MSEENFSHPEQNIRHTYPVSEEGYGLGTALKLLMKTSPYIIARLTVLVGFTVGAIIWFGINVAIASLWAGTDSEGVGGITLLIGFGLPAGLYFWLRKYVLYILKAGHIAVLTKLITEGSLPDGVNQVSY